ncbi:MAG TPA: glycosyltransferase [Fimbriimonadaceae bacterium]|nr:glycosyltransferase [Fimbriimonadaceae bacterium]
MKVVIVNDYARINGGAAKVALRSAIALAERGIEVEVFAGIGPALPDLEKRGIKVTTIRETPYNRDPRKLAGAIKGIWDAEAARRFKEVLKGCDPKDTIVHFHTFRDALSASVAYAADRMGFVTVYTAHEYTLGCPYGGFFDYRRNQICHLKGLSGACLASHCNTGAYFKKLWFYASQFVYAKIARIPRRLKHVIYLSQLSRKALAGYVPASTRSSFVSNPFDPMAGQPAPLTPDSPFLFVGSLASHKDPVTAAKAAKALGAKITFIGSGPVEEEVRAANPEAEITGWLDRNAIAERMAHGRALLFPSIWYEAQPLTTMEAAASGLSIIAADASAAVEQIEQLGVGEVFRRGDVDDLIAKMKPYLDDAYAHERGMAAYKAFCRLDLSEERHVNRLLEIYEAELALAGRTSHPQPPPSVSE